MPCLVAILALFWPRFIIVVLVLTGDYIGRAYDTFLVPLLGFFLMPATTLAWAWAVNSGGASGERLIVVALGLLYDLGLLGFGARGRRPRSS